MLTISNRQRRAAARSRRPAAPRPRQQNPQPGPHHHPTRSPRDGRASTRRPPPGRARHHRGPPGLAAFRSSSARAKGFRSRSRRGEMVHNQARSAAGRWRPLSRRQNAATYQRRSGRSTWPRPPSRPPLRLLLCRLALRPDSAWIAETCIHPQPGRPNHDNPGVLDAPIPALPMTIMCGDSPSRCQPTAPPPSPAANGMISPGVTDVPVTRHETRGTRRPSTWPGWHGDAG